MKKLLLVVLLVSAIQVKGQITMSDVLRLGRLHSNAYNINARSFIDARDMLQLMGYPLMKFEPSTVSPTDKFFTFYFQKSGNDKEKVTIVSQYFKANGVQKIVFKTSVTTNDIDVFNAMLENATKHPDFEVIGPNLFTNNFKAKPSIGVEEQLIFSKGYTVLPSGEMNIQMPIVYTITYSREL